MKFPARIIDIDGDTEIGDLEYAVMIDHDISRFDILSFDEKEIIEHA